MTITILFDSKWKKGRKFSLPDWGEGDVDGMQPIGGANMSMRTNERGHCAGPT